MEDRRMVGQILSHYTVVEKLGEGGMGVVYRALDGPSSSQIRLDECIVTVKSLHRPGVGAILRRGEKPVHAILQKI